MAGCGWRAGIVTGQEPAPGTPLSPDRSIVLSVAGTGLGADLPLGMWDRGGETEPGTEELLALFDDPLQKMAHGIREGALLFDICRDNPAACGRWLSLFGFSLDDWPSEMLYTLALLLPSLQRLSGTLKGMRFIFSALLRLPLLEVRRRPSIVRLEADQHSRLGARHSCLSVDLIAGDYREALSAWTLVFGPVALSTYHLYQDPYHQKLLCNVASLAVPYHQLLETAWSVLDARRAPRLGFAIENGALGVNSHLGPLGHNELACPTEISK